MGIVIRGVEGDVPIDTASEAVTEYAVATFADGDSLIDTVTEAVLWGTEGDVIIDTVSEGVAMLLVAYADTNTIAKITTNRVFFGRRTR